jgi:hypothetical protein
MTSLEELKELFGRNEAHEQKRCLREPIGCGQQLTPEEYDSWDELTKKEYDLSALCKGCQTGIFDECTCANPCCSVDIGVGVTTCGSSHCPQHGEPS